ncbi:hypothetical protein E2542_SST31477 [Spatholobus suberectus]|nr:hypothetical protein E2542_SST31477 [Spatholobus suberectus]
MERERKSNDNDVTIEHFRRRRRDNGGRVVIWSTMVVDDRGGKDDSFTFVWWFLCCDLVLVLKAERGCFEQKSGCWMGNLGFGGDACKQLLETGIQKELTENSITSFEKSINGLEDVAKLQILIDHVTTDPAISVGIANLVEFPNCDFQVNPQNQHIQMSPN